MSGLLMLILSIAVQAGLIIHVIKTGRNQIWIWVLALLSLPGAIAYIVVEILPELFGSRAARRTARGFKRALDPGAELRRLEAETRATGNVASRQRYGDALSAAGRHEEAIVQYREALTGLYEHDPKLMLGLARAQFDKGDPAAARQTLDTLILHNPEFRSPEGHLLYARSLEGEGQAARALEEYRVLAPSYPGAEGAVRYAQLLRAQGQEEEAARIARELLEQARIAPAHYRKAQRNWLDLAERIASAR